MVLLLLAAVPLFGMGAFIAVQNARIVASRARDHVAVATHALIVRQQSFLWEGERMLTALAVSEGMDDFDAETCAASLRRILMVPGERYFDLSIRGIDGTLRCGAAMDGDPEPRADDPSIAKAAASGGFAIGRVAPPQGLRPATLSIAMGAEGRAVVAAHLREDRLLAGPEGAVADTGLLAWLIQDDGAPVPLVDEAGGGFPAPADRTRLLSKPGVVLLGASLDGRPYVYAAAQLSSGLELVLAEPAGADLSVADSVLGRRLAELGLVLLLGLAGVALGADIAIARPLKQVARSVARWRAGGRFDPGSLDRAPAEVKELAQSFSEATAALDTREQQLRESAAQQELLMQEIHHRVKNNLQVIASLLNLQANRIRQPEAKAEFHAARDRIRALATLHRHLYAHGELHTINMRGFLEELCHQLLQAMGETIPGGRIALSIDAPQLSISSDQAVPIALLVTEAVSNAVKYAFPAGRSGHISVGLAVRRDASGQDIGHLTIDDDGVGIPAGRAETDAGVRDGIGLRLIRGFARQLGSDLVIREGEGTHYAVDILLQRERFGSDVAEARAMGQDAA